MGYINKIHTGDTAHLIEPTLYGVCETIAGTAAKTVTLSDFELQTGVQVAVKFTATNTADNPTLSINGSTAKAIYYQGSAINKNFLIAGQTYNFIYNGTQWDLISDPTKFSIGDTLSITNGGTGATSATSALANLGGVAAITSTDNAIARFDGTTGQLQDSGVTIDDNNNIVTSGNYIENAAGCFRKVQLLPSVAWSNFTNNSWYRCCKIANKYNCPNFIMQMSGSWSTGAPTIATISISVVGSSAAITLLNCSKVGVIKAIRIVDNNGLWLDVQIAKQSSGSIGVQRANFIGNVVVSDINTTLTETTDSTTPVATLTFVEGYINANATSANALITQAVTSTTLNNTSGTFAFSGSGSPWSGYDWVGLQVGSDSDKFQIVGTIDSNSLLFRNNNSGGTNTSWGNWQIIAHAQKGSTDIGGATQPIYMTSTGVITAGTALKDLAYIDKPTSDVTTKYLRGDGSWVTLSDMGLSSAMHYIGTVSTDPISTAPSGTYAAGDVVVYDTSEYVYDGTNWRELGSESSYALLGHDHNTVYYKLDGSNTGTKLSISTQSAAYTDGICFMNSTTKKGSVGCDNTGIMCMYGASKISLRPVLNAATDGVEITTTSMIPTKNNTVALGGTSNKWSNVYATTFTGNLSGNATSSSALKNINASTGSGNRPTSADLTHVNNGGVQHFKVADETNSIVGNILHFHWDTSSAWDSQLLIPQSSSDTSMKYRASSAAGTWASWKTLLDSSNYSTYAATSIHTHGNITNDGKLSTANRLVWTDASSNIYAGDHYIDSTHIAIGSTSTTTKTLYVNGNSEFNLNSDSSSDKKLLLTGVNAELTIGSQGIQSYNKGTTTPHVLYLQYAGSDLWIGSSTTTNAVRNFYGKFEFFTTSGFNYSGIGVTSTASTGDRSIWFGGASAPGIPVIDNNFKYNPATNTITIGTGTLSATSYSGNAASASAISATLATTTKTYLLGTSTAITATAANVNLIGDTGVYMTTTAGELSALKYSINDGTNEKVRLEYNSTDQSLDFIFI